MTNILILYNFKLDKLIQIWHNLIININEGIHARYQLTSILRRKSWQEVNKQDNCVLTSNNVIKFLNIIPKALKPSQKIFKKDFTRTRKLPFPQLITFILSITVSGKSKGVDSKSGEFFKNAKRSGLWPESQAVHRSALTKARQKVSWQVFQDIFYKAVSLAYELFPTDVKYLWKGMSVYAIDGSKHDLPATEKIREEFDPKSGLSNTGKGHYPQCLVSTVFDVFRQIPIARTVTSYHGSEREEVKNLLPYIPNNNILLFDRGYPSYELINHLNVAYSGYYVFRCPSSNTFTAVLNFIKSKKDEDVIWITPTGKILNKTSKNDRKHLNPIKLRIIRLCSPDGVVSVLLTNLFEKKEFSKKEISDLYFRRWTVETYYRDEKYVLEIEKFHAKTGNGIRQELFASVTMAVITRTLMILSMNNSDLKEVEPQFKNAIMTLASEAAVLTTNNPEKAIDIFQEILTEIKRVKYYRPKNKRLSQPRVCKKPLNKWSKAKIYNLAAP